MRKQLIDANDLTFETHLWGEAHKPLLLFLHGFPEHAGAWAEIAPRFANDYLCVAPNQRGYGKSSKPQGVAAYRVQHLARDMLTLAEQLSPSRPFHVVAHDWGASVAYMMAFMASKRIKTLTVANGVHPLPFQRAILDDAEQRAASQYMRFLQRDDAGALLSADGHQRLLQFLTKGLGGGTWMTDAQRAAYLAVWSEPGAVEGMVSWYKATQLVVPAVDAPKPEDPLAKINPAMVRVRMPHLLLWGMADKALRPVTMASLGDYCDDLTVKTFDDADHWIVHQKPDDVCHEMTTFLARHRDA